MTTCRRGEGGGGGVPVHMTNNVEGYHDGGWGGGGM